MPLWQQLQNNFPDRASRYSFWKSCTLEAAGIFVSDNLLPFDRYRLFIPRVFSCDLTILSLASPCGTALFPGSLRAHASTWAESILLSPGREGISSTSSSSMYMISCSPSITSSSSELSFRNLRLFLWQTDRQTNRQTDGRTNGRIKGVLGLL